MDQWIFFCIIQFYEWIWECRKSTINRFRLSIHFHWWVKVLNDSTFVLIVLIAIGQQTQLLYNRLMNRFFSKEFIIKKIDARIRCTRFLWWPIVFFWDGKTPSIVYGWHICMRFGMLTKCSIHKRSNYFNLLSFKFRIAHIHWHNFYYSHSVSLCLSSFCLFQILFEQVRKMQKTSICHFKWKKKENNNNNNNKNSRALTNNYSK